MHQRSLRLPAIAGALGLFFLAGCEGSGSAAETSSPESTSTDAVAVSSTGEMQVDMDAIFPQAPGRDLVLNNCQNCHTFVPIVVLQMNEDEWNRWAMEHRQRVTALSDEEFATLKGYLIENFNPNTPVPELPPVLLESWTTY